MQYIQKYLVQTDFETFYPQKIRTLIFNHNYTEPLSPGDDNNGDVKRVNEVFVCKMDGIIGSISLLLVGGIHYFGFNVVDSNCYKAVNMCILKFVTKRIGFQFQNQMV